MGKIVWLRHETKPFEERCALTPAAAKILLNQGHRVIVENSPTRSFQDKEFLAVGCELAAMNSWKTKAPSNAIILGLKELEDECFPLIHDHIHFAHVYKGQDGARETLSRFSNGGGKLYDLEYLTDQDERRIAAFGVWAGFVGAGLGLELWTSQKLGFDYNKNAPLQPYKNQNEFISTIEDYLGRVKSRPRVLVIGAYGRCGQGAVKLLRAAGIEPTLWGSQDTKGKGPISEILEYDLLINCALMTYKTAPFLDKNIIKEERHLTAISDVGCDPTGPCNPLPIYNQITTIDRPVHTIDEENLLQITAIDHLPSLLPRESSQDFCEQLLPHLLKFLGNEIVNTPFERSLEMFYTQSAELGLRRSGPEISLQ